MQSFDIVLVFANFRRSSIFLPIIKAMGRQISIGVLSLNLPSKEKKKTHSTDSQFLNLCTELGAKILNGSRYHAKISIIPQWPYSEDQRNFIISSLKSDRIFLMIGLTMGNYNYDRLGNIKVDKLLIMDIDLYYYRLTVRKEERSFDIQKDMLVEIGIPFAKYQVLPDMGIDYLWAHPTPLSLPEAINRLEYFECVKKLMEKIPVDNIIALKPHNAVEYHDYIVNPFAFSLMKFPLIQPFAKKISIFSRKMAKKCSNVILKNIFINICIAHIYMEILNRVILLEELTPYYNFSLELMLPRIKKGLITGRSNSIWHGLFMKLPVYNCVNKSHIRENKDKMNYHSMKYFEVPYCNGRLEFDDKYFSIIDEKTQKNDFIKWLSKELVSKAPK